MRLQVLVSTMNEANIDNLIKNMKIKSGFVVNQLTSKRAMKAQKSATNMNGYSYAGKGLSESRNIALSKTTADIVQIADDDLYYVRNYDKIILAGYEKYQDADIIAFYVDHENPKLRAPKLPEGKIGLLKSMKIVSYQISLRPKSLRNKNIIFDENFGTGTKKIMGEESILLFDCINAGLKIYSVPIKIATLKDDSVSTWFKGYDAEYFRVKGMVFYRMSNILAVPLALQFIIRKRKIYTSEITARKALSCIFHGIKLEAALVKQNSRNMAEH